MNPYRALPSVDQLATEFKGRLPRLLLVDACRAAVEQARTDIDSDAPDDVHAEVERIIATIERSAGIGVINATGVLLHTNLGRAVWSEAATQRAHQAARHYTNVELDLATGERSRRGGYAASLLRALTGAEDALIVNNNAAAVLLALAACSAGRAVPVSRGELIEIGGSYRLPDVMEASGAKLVEVGTTNRTRAGDYETALQLHDCGAVLKVHPSNYRVAGFTQEASTKVLAALAMEAGVALIHDIGSGLLDETTPWLETGTPAWLQGEPGARQSLDDGAHLVTFSGDKLLGGPQAGIIVGATEWVELLRNHPLARAMRVDGTIHAGLAATLEAYANGTVTQIPFWAQATLGNDILGGRVSSLAAQLGGEVTDGHSTIGAGSTPGMTIPSPQLLLKGEDHLYEKLLRSETPVIGRRESGNLILDLRTVEAGYDELIATTVLQCR